MIQLELQFIQEQKRECPECGDEVTGRADKVYCSRRCKEIRWRQENLEKHRETSKRWRQENLEKSRELTRRWQQVNREKTRETSRRWYHKNTEKHREISKRWQQANPEKLRVYNHRRRAKREANGIEPTEEYRALLVNPLTRQVCHYCGTDCTGNHHWDHFIPISKGGPEAPWNLVIACPTCNLRKKAKLPTSIFCEEIFKE